MRTACVSSALLAGAALLVLGAGVASAGKPFRVYLSFEGQAETELPPDWNVPGEFVVGRLMYPSYRGLFGSGWERGGTSWAVDYPRGDRKLAEVLRRFTRADVRSVEQPVNPNDGDDIYDWPFLMVGLAGYRDLTDEQVLALRTYLLRGGFLFADSFFGSDSWVGFQEGLKRVFPDRPIIDLGDDHRARKRQRAAAVALESSSPAGGGIVAMYSRSSAAVSGCGSAAARWNGSL